MFKIKGKIDGLSDVLRQLDGLKKSTRGTILRRALNEAGRLLLKEAKRLAPKDTGLLRKSLGRKVKIYPSGVGVALVGPRVGFRQEVTRKRGRRTPVTLTANPTRYAHLVELGTNHSRAKPFLAPAISGLSSTIRDAMAAKIKESLAKEAAKGGR